MKNKNSVILLMLFFIIVLSAAFINSFPEEWRVFIVLIDLGLLIVLLFLRKKIVD